MKFIWVYIAYLMGLTTGWFILNTLGYQTSLSLVIFLAMIPQVGLFFAIITVFIYFLYEEEEE